MIDWPPGKPLTPEQEDLVHRLWDPVSEDQLRRPSTAWTLEEAYDMQRKLLRANRVWRRATRLHYWRLRYRLYRMWARVSRPWEDRTHERRAAVYQRYWQAKADLDAAREAQELGPEGETD